MSVRDPDQVLEELGAGVERAWARRRARPLWRRLLPARRGAAIGLGVVLALVPTAVATQDVLFAPKPPALPAELRAPALRTRPAPATPSTSRAAPTGSSARPPANTGAISWWACS